MKAELNIENAVLPLGATLLAQGVFFKVWAPNAQEVAVFGSFNDWNEDEYPLEKTENGEWQLPVSTAKAGDEYKFIITDAAGNKLYKNDPRAKQMTNSVGNSVVFDPHFDWEGSEDFQTESLNNLVIYELHLGTFNKTTEQVGDFYTAMEKLPYLKDLGINAVEIMPVSEFPGDYSWGYNPASPFAVESAYGGPVAFKEFVKAAHKTGIAVILDVVYNHFGPSDMDIWQFDGWSENNLGGIYFYNDWKASTPWGDTRPDYGRGEVRQYIYDNALMWVSEFKVDGLRMDMVPYMRNVKADGNPGNALEDGKSLIQWINKSLGEQFPGTFVVAEDLHTLDDITKDVDQGGFGYSSQWCAAFVHPVREVLTNINDTDRDLKKIENSLLKRYNLDVFERVVYTESHDEVANGQARLAEEIANGDVNNYFSRKRSLIAATLVLTSPGIPMLFQGQELLEDGYFDDGDPIDWQNLKTYKGFTAFFRDLIHLRRNWENKTRGLIAQNIEITHFNNTDKVLGYHRFDQKGVHDSVMVIINFANVAHENYEIVFPQEGNWQLCINADSNLYNKKNPNRDIDISYEGTKANLFLPEYAILIFRMED